MRWTLPASLMLVVLHLAVCTRASAGAPGLSLDWVDRVLEKAMMPPTRSDAPGGISMDCRLPRSELRSAQCAFSSILAKYGPSARAYIGLARSQMGQGRYEAAERSYLMAMGICPGAPGLPEELELAGESRRISASSRTNLPRNHTVLRALPFPVERARKLWLVLSGRIDDMGPDLLCSAAFDGADFRLTLVGDAGSGVRLLWQSAQLGYPGNTDGCFNDVQLYVLDITGDGTPEAVIPEVFIGASWAPSHLDVFTWQDGRIFHALGVKSDEPVELRDIDGDGSYEVINNHAIGQSLSHAGQPRWTDVFGYRDGTYRIANHRFPARFSQLRAEVRGVLRKYPSDPELLMCLGVAEQILGHPREALRAYTRSRRGYAGELNAETDHRERVRIRGRLSELDNRIHGIQAAPR